MFIRQLKTALAAIIFLFLSWRCTKIDTTNLGEGLIPAVDNVNTFDTTIAVIANNFDSTMCDSVYRTDLHVLGIIPDDPYFGKTTANIYLELKPTYYPFAFPASDKDSLLLDSAVLVLQYSHTYGDSLQPQKALIYPVNERFSPDSNYTTCKIFDYDNTQLLGEQTYIPARLTDSIHAFREDANNQLRIRLSNAFAQKFITDSALIFKNDTTFTDYFKGFAIVADELSGGNGLNYFDISSVNTRLSFYLRTSVANVKDTSVIDFPLTSDAGEANSVIRERGSSEITNHVDHNPLGDSLIYIQASPGSYAEIKIPALSTLSNRVIHRAELIVDQVYSPAASDAILTTPDYLFLDADTSGNGDYVPMPCDFNTLTTLPDFNYLGGTKKIISDGSGNPISQYVFNISRYVQSIVTKKDSNVTLRLRAPYFIENKTAYSDRCNQYISPFVYSLNNIAEGGVKLNGSNNTSTRMKLHIVYSLL